MVSISERVLRVPQSEADGSFVLLHLTSTGSSPLDLKLVGTEGAAPYVIKLKQEKIASTKASGATASDQEWTDILVSFFSQQPLEDIHATAAVQSESSITITLRKQVQSISQRLGAITLKYDPDEAIELFEWCASAANEVLQTKLSASIAQKELSELRDSVTFLKKQLEDTLVAKANDETTMLQKFRDLLNEKKAKIRDQNTIITGGNLVTTTARAASPQDQSPEPRTGKAAKPRPKRKAPARSKRAAAEEESEAEDAAPLMSSVDVKVEPDDSDNDGHTTERTASVASETEDEDGDRRMGDGTNTSLSDSQIAKERLTEPADSQKPAQKVSQAPPPKRELPFANKKTSRLAPVAVASNEQTDSDDEL